MSGNGGSAGYNDLATYQKDIHGLMMLGLTSLGRNWQGVLANSAGISVAVLHTAGLGYTVGELVRVTGAGAANALLEITKITVGTGAVEEFTIFAAGTSYDTATNVATTAFETSSTGDDNFTIDIYAVSDRPYAIEATYRENPSVARFILERGLTDVGGNPFAGRRAYNPDSDLEEMDVQVTALKRKIEALSPATDLASDFDTAITETADASVVSSLSAEAVAQAMSFASTLVTTALMQAQAHATSVSETLHTAVAARESTYSSAALTAAVASAKEIYNAALAGTTVMSPANTVQVDATNALTAMTPAIDALTQMALTIAQQGAREVINSAMSNALTMIDDGFVAMAVKNYERRGLRNFLRNVNRFTAPMADIGATDGSSYVMGLALLHSDFQQDISDYQAKLEMQLFQQLFDNFVSFSANMMQAYLQSYASQYALRTGLYEQLYTALAGQSLQNLTVFARMIESIFGGKLDVYKMVNQDAVVFDTAAKAQTNAAMAENSLYIDTALRERLTLLPLGIEQMHNRRTLELTANNAFANTVAETKRLRIVAKNEEKNRQDEYDIKTATWDLELFQLGGNILSAVSGSVVPTAAKPSTAQSVLGGAFAGASIGAQMGNPAAIGVGAVAGALGGAIL